MREPSLETSLRRWWVKKYQRPWTDDAAQESTLPDLLVEFYEDFFTEHPAEARKALSVDGNYIFTDTGDDLIDKWEAEVAAGLEPDLTEAMSPTAKARMKKDAEKAKRGKQQFESLVQEPKNFGELSDYIDLLKDR